MEHVVRFLPSGRTIRGETGTRLLELAHRAQLPVASACGAEALCGRCGLQILAGLVEPEAGGESEVKRRNRVDPSLRLACLVRVEDDLVVTAPYW